MEDFIFTPIVLVVGLGIQVAVLRMHTRQEQRLLNLAFVGHVASAFAQVLLARHYFHGIADMLSYYREGVELAALMRSDFPRFAPEVLAAFFRADFNLPVDFYGSGSTTSMSAAAGLLLFAVGDSLYAAVVAVSIGSHLSMVLLYRALRAELPAAQHHLVLVGTGLLPSAVFWSAALLKESLVMCTLGPMVLALRWLASGHRRVGALVMLAISALITAMVKPYILMALSFAAAAYYLVQRLYAPGSAALKPFALTTAALLAAGGLVVGNKYFTKAENDSTTEMFARQRTAFTHIEGGSNFQLENPTTAASERSLSRELVLAPVALGTALFRPFLFEARNAMQFVNALEATLLLVFFLQALRRKRWGQLVAEVRSSPALLFCLVFTLALGLGAGLTTPNMGSLSRYRAPMMPMFFTLLLILRARPETSEASTEVALTPAGAAR